MSSQIKWTNAQISMLIKLFRQEKYLYDYNHPSYRSNAKRQEGYRRIFKRLKPYRLDLTINHIQRKLKGLRSIFSAELVKVEERKLKYGGNIDERELTKLWYYNEMKFLKKYFRKYTTDTLETSSNSSVKSEKKSNKDHKTKCGEMFIDNDGTFTFICYDCGQEYLESQEIFEHILTDHFGKNNIDDSTIYFKQEQIDIVDEESYHEMNVDVVDEINKPLDEINNPLDESNNPLDAIDSNVEKTTKNIKPYKCDECEETFRFERILIGHKKINHNDEFTVKNDFTCNICNITLPTFRQHLSHMKNTHEENTCKICGVKLAKKRSVLQHIKRMHTDTEKKFICDYCNHGFKEKCNLERHFRTHTKQKPYKCNVCDKSFGWSSYLAVHLQLHKGKNVICEVCGAKFVSKSKLNIHMKLHNNVRRYKCDKCSEKYYRIESLKRHQIKHYDGSFVCKICHYDCHTRDWLREHKCFSQKKPSRIRPIGLNVETNIETITADNLLFNDMGFD